MFKKGPQTWRRDQDKRRKKRHMVKNIIFSDYNNNIYNNIYKNNNNKYEFKKKVKNASLQRTYNIGDTLLDCIIFKV